MFEALDAPGTILSRMLTEVARTAKFVERRRKNLVEVFDDAKDLANAPSVASAEINAFVSLCAHLNYQQTAANPQIGSSSQQGIPTEHSNP